MMRYGSALLPTGTKMNPTRPEMAEYFDENQVAIIVQKKKGFFELDPVSIPEIRSLRILTSFGNLESWQIGSVRSIFHDQTQRNLGTFKVIGKINFKTKESSGMIPNHSLPHWVFK